MASVSVSVFLWSQHQHGTLAPSCTDDSLLWSLWQGVHPGELEAHTLLNAHTHTHRGPYTLTLTDCAIHPLTPIHACFSLSHFLVQSLSKSWKKKKKSPVPFWSSVFLSWSNLHRKIYTCTKSQTEISSAWFNGVTFLLSLSLLSFFIMYLKVCGINVICSFEQQKKIHILSVWT